MRDVQELRDELAGLGFGRLKDNMTNEQTGLVEVWVRYTPYEIVALPIRGESESDDSYNERWHAADVQVREIFEAAQIEFVASEDEVTQIPVEEEPQPEEAPIEFEPEFEDVANETPTDEPAHQPSHSSDALEQILFALLRTNELLEGLLKKAERTE